MKLYKGGDRVRMNPQCPYEHAVGAIGKVAHGPYIFLRFDGGEVLSFGKPIRHDFTSKREPTQGAEHVVYYSVILDAPAMKHESGVWNVPASWLDDETKEAAPKAALVKP